MLYLVATPIGNLKDLSVRACELLQKVDYVLCENKNRSQILFKYYGISTPLKPYHRFSEAKLEEQLIEDLKKEKEIALISDAGTPGISDPGNRLIRRCQKEGISYSALPGPCAPILALTLSGFEVLPFQFLGFLPKSSSLLRRTLAQALSYPGTTLCFESPHRMNKTLKLLEEMDKDRKLAIARELTKIYEEVRIGSAKELQSTPLLGEMVLIISGTSSPDLHSLSPEEHVSYLQNMYGLSKQEAIKMAAQLRGVPKKEIYF